MEAVSDAEPWLTWEAFDKFSMKPSFRDLLLQKQKELDDHEVTQGEVQTEPTPVAPPVTEPEKPQTEQPVERKTSAIAHIWSTIVERNAPEEKIQKPAKQNIISTKRKGKTQRIPFPRPSYLTKRENTEYLELRSKFLPISTQQNSSQHKEFTRFKELHKLVLAEQAEFYVYLENLAQQSVDDYDYMHPQAHEYLIARLSKLHTQVKCYPQFYMMLDSVSLVPPKVPQNIPFTHVKTLLELGEIIRVLIPNEKTQKNGIFIPVEGNRIRSRFPVGKDDPMNPPCSQDSNASRLSEKYLPHVVISSAALKCILDNQPPHYHRQWEIPVHVKSVPFEENKESKLHKVIVVDKPLVPRVLSVRERSHRFYKMAAKAYFQHPMHSSLRLSQPVVDSSKESLADIEPEVDPSSLETFGMSETESAKTKLTVISEEEEKLNLDKSDKSADEEKLNTDGFFSTTTDSEDEKLVIDAEVPTPRRITRSQSEGKSEARDVVLKRRMSSPLSACESKKSKEERASSVCKELRNRNIVVDEPAKEVKKTVPPLDDILPTQAKKKAEPQEKRKKNQTLTEYKNGESAEWQMCEKPDGYNPPLTGHNVTYNLWQLGSFRLLIRCKYHGYAKLHKNQKPFNVGLSPKIEYQPQFGVEQMTFSESCRDWVTCAIRKECHLVRARINANTSELMMTEMVKPEQIFQTCIPFNPVVGLNVLHSFLAKLYQLSEGHYLITHTDGNLQAQIKKTTTSTTGVYDLHERNAISVPTSLNVPWIPIDPNVMSKLHKKNNRIPATFEPKDAVTNKPVRQDQTKHQQNKKKKKKNRNK